MQPSLFTGGVTFSNTDAIANTTDDVLYNTERYGNPFSYNIPLQNGNYNVTLKFAETIFTAPNVRVFDVLMEGTERISNLDFYQTAGADTAYDVTLPVTVSDGTLNIIFRADVENAKINAIKVVPAPAGRTACHLYTPTSSIPSGFGAPWDVFSANELLMRATCHPSTSSGQADATLDFGRGVSTQYIYNTGYHYHAGLSGWMPMTLTSAETLIANAWYPKTATVTLTGLDLTNTTHYALGYICPWTGSQWKCGCRDQACTQSYWQIQSFKR